jgi:Asp-tRNA(Asn)/Glu-tRNA(Gln) amidotransferase A subunit family amidase
MTGKEALASVGKSPGRMRLAVPPASWIEGLDAETAIAWQRVSSGLPEVRLPDRAAMSQACTTISMYEASAYHSTWITEHPERYGADVRDRLVTGMSIPNAVYTQALGQRPELLAQVEEAMRGFDALLVPATAIVAPLVGGPDVREPMTRFTRPFSATGQPVATVPARSGGLPVGIQIVGRFGYDAQLLQIAHALETLWR